jgi:PAS domain S-box-containing protein
MEAYLNGRGERRCGSCQKLLAKGITSHSLEIKCARCGILNPFLCREKQFLCVADLRGHMVYLKGVVSEMTGYSIHECLLKPWTLFSLPLDNAQEKAFHQIVFQKKNVAVARLANQKKNGELYTVFIRLTPVSDIGKFILSGWF